MDTTVALIFSLGIAMSGSPATESNNQNALHEPTAETQVVNARSQADIRRAKHTRIKQRIALTNAWLKQQKQLRRHAQQQRMDLADASSVCTASWKTT